MHFIATTTVKHATTQLDRIFIIHPVNCLNYNNALNLQQTFTEVLSFSPTLCIIDLSKVYFADSSALFQAIAVYKNAKQQKCRLVFCCLQPSIKLMLEITQLDRVFEIFDSLEDVLKQCTKIKSATFLLKKSKQFSNVLLDFL
ncbi:hypothetical protein C7B79_01870 [Chroococcidiopsis cubana CCALA 043]|uniref:STAS domain-containing protein n=1 Tax=Chroococcidiopsis cubana TaxID=171392 RepID=UPI000D04C8B5|nr:hypothetical protein C7B79_01870 [Chroococcidiopsis cubana CCALA 043]